MLNTLMKRTPATLEKILVTLYVRIVGRKNEVTVFSVDGKILGRIQGAVLTTQCALPGAGHQN